MGISEVVVFFVFMFCCVAAYIISVLEFPGLKSGDFCHFSWILNRAGTNCWQSRLQIKRCKLSPGLLEIIHYVRIKDLHLNED